MGKDADEEVGGGLARERQLKRRSSVLSGLRSDNHVYLRRFPNAAAAKGGRWRGQASLISSGTGTALGTGGAFRLVGWAAVE